MSHVIKFLEVAGPFKCDVPEGSWLTSFTDTPDGRGAYSFSLDPAKAMRFATGGEALDFWHQQSKTVPIRPDGRPNRPLTAFTCCIEREDQMYENQNR